MSIKTSQLLTAADSGVLRRVQTAFSIKSKSVSAFDDRLALEVASYKQRLADIEWDAKSSGVHGFFRRKQPLQGRSLGRIKLHVQAAMHKRAAEVLQVQTDASASWKHHLRHDAIYRTLFFQLQWIRTVLDKAAPTNSPRRQSADECLAAPEPTRPRRFSLDEFNNDTPSLAQLLEEDLATSDCPSDAYLAFEHFLSLNRFEQTDLGVAFEKHCCASLLALNDPAAPSTSFSALVTQLASTLADEHDVSPTNPHLLAHVRQMIFCRMGAVFVAPVASTLPSWSGTQARAMALDQLRDAGLAASSLRATIAAFEEMPFFMPDHMVRSLLQAIALLHVEVGIALKCDSNALSADVLLPALVAVITHSKVPFLHAQVFCMESLALNNGNDGGEAAYYVALLQSALAAAVIHV
ncbi:Aste57867_20925 [Aphanomyces stellatus]|uniref:Aste57867_20925 protein n=1 Tax=Aphanomyces stellatus TaxID=120398 RepID=A0A485LI80_9STRA|nr:hypothetical protein As57867_020857 [Aphanomyces stellatus]VFT97602.1 Aste57867_20925 [Aphanomyces stellatus]